MVSACSDVEVSTKQVLPVVAENFAVSVWSSITVNVYGLAVEMLRVPSYQPLKVRPAAGIAFSVHFSPKAYLPPPVTLPDIALSERAVIVYSTLFTVTTFVYV